MTALTKPRMNVDEFLAWAVDQPGRFELFRGEVYAMSDTPTLRLPSTMPCWRASERAISPVMYFPTV